MQGQRVLFPKVGVCQIERFEVPSAPPPGQVLVRIRRTLVSPGTEFAVFSGRHTNLSRSGDLWPRFPFYPGYSAVGEVLAKGEGVDHVCPGDTVFAEAPHASHALVPGAKVIKVAPALGLERPAFTELGAIALHGVRSGGVMLGERVAVFGQGIVGLLALRLAHAAGATRLTAFDLDPRRLEIARRWGAGTTMTPEDGARQVEMMRAENGGHLSDVVIEATGNPIVISACLSCARTGGRVVLLGSPHGSIMINFYEDVQSRNLRLIGAHVGASEHAATNAAPWNRDRNRQTFLDLVLRGDVPVEELVTHRLTPSDLLEFYRGATERPGEFLGVIVDWENAG